MQRGGMHHGELRQFESERAARSHCPSGTIVRLNTKSGVYHAKGMRSYGYTKQGAYVCNTEADNAGDRDTRYRQ